MTPLLSRQVSFLLSYLSPDNNCQNKKQFPIDYSKGNMSSEVEETLKRLVAHKGVIGTIVVNNDGIPIKSTLDNHTTTQYAGLINQLVDQVLI